MALARASSRVPNSRGNRDASLSTPPAIAGRPSPAVDRGARLIPLEGSLLPDVEEPNEEDGHEHEHLPKTEERIRARRTRAAHQRHGTRKFTEVRGPRDHEDGL